MASVVEICNGALIRLGASTITLLTDNTVGAKAVNAVYDRKRRELLRQHPWNFAIVRGSLAADATAPIFGKNNSFTLPADFLRLLPPDPCFNYNDLDWQIEGRAILSDDAGPINVRYISDVTDPNKMDALFRETLSLDIANEICEKLTQSNTKKQDISNDRLAMIREAKRTNAIENRPAVAPQDTWITKRL